MAEGAGREVGRISIKVTPNLEGFREKIATELRAIEAQDHDIHIGVDMDTGQAAADLERLRAIAAKDLHVKVHLEVADGSLAKLEIEKLAVGAASRSGGSSFGGGGGGGFGLSAGYARDFALIGSVVALLAPALALLSGALVTLPAIIAGVVAPVGVLALGMGGLKKAAEETGWLTDTPGKRGGKDKLSPGAELKDLMKVASDSIHDSFVPALRQLGDVLQPLKAGIPAVAKGLGDMASGVVNALVSPAGKAGITGIMNNIGAGLTAAAPGLQSFTTALINLTSHVTEHAPALSKWFDSVGSSLDKWVSKITTPDATGDTPLNKGLRSFGSTLKPFADTAGDMLDQGFKWLSSPEFGNSMHQFVTDAQGFVNGVLPELGKFFSSITEFANSIRGISDSLDKASKSPLGKFFFGDHTPDPTHDSPGHDSVIPKSTVDAYNGKPVGGGTPLDAAGGFFGAMSRLPDNMDKWGLQIKESFKGFIGNLLIPTRIGGGTAGAAEAPFDPGKPGPQVPSWWQKGLNKDWINPPAPPGGFHFGPPAGLTGDGGAGALPEIVAPPQSKERLHQSGGRDEGPVTPWEIPGMAPSKGPDLAGPAKASADGVKGAFSGVAAAVAPVWQKIQADAKTAFAGITAAAQAAVQSIIAALQGLGAAGQAAGMALGQGLAAGIATSATLAVAAAKTMASEVEDAAKVHLGIKSPSTVFHGIGVNAGEGMANGLDEGTGTAVERARNLAQSITNAVNSGMDFDKGAVGQQIKDLMGEIKVQEDRLHVQGDNTTDKGAKKGIQDQLKQIKAAKDELKLDKDEFGLGGKGSKSGKDTHDESMQQSASMLTTAFAQILDAGKGFAMANVNQFEQDVGMSGNGAVETIANTGINWLMGLANKGASGLLSAGTKNLGGGDTHYHVSNVDEALQVQQHKDNKQALQHTQR